MSSKRTTYKSSHAKDVVWSKADKVKGKNPDVYRRDPYGNELYYSSYGKYSEKGWHIDHTSITIYNKLFVIEFKYQS
jgi:hypothetical protein